MKKLILVFVALFAVAAFADQTVPTIQQGTPSEAQVTAPATTQAPVEHKKAKKKHAHKKAPVAATPAAAPAPAAK